MLAVTIPVTSTDATKRSVDCSDSTETPLVVSLKESPQYKVADLGVNGLRSHAQSAIAAINSTNSFLIKNNFIS